MKWQKGQDLFSIAALVSSKDLHKRLLFTFVVLVCYRFASFVPLPGVDMVAVEALGAKISGSFFGMFDVFSGGSLSRMTIMALNIAPYISSSILFQLLGAVSPYFAALKKQGEVGRAKINQYTRYGALVLSIVQGYGLATYLELVKEGSEIVMFPGFGFRFMACLIFCCSTMIVMWLGEQITARGIGNGSSVIIYAGIVANLPGAIIRLFAMGRNGQISIAQVFLVCFLALFLLVFIVFVERIERPIEILYSRKQISAKMAQESHSSTLPVKLNPAGVLPPMFASSVLLVPATILAGVGLGKYEWGKYVISCLSHGTIFFTVMYAVLILFFSSFYALLVFDPKETAENLNRSGGFIRGYRPGQKTAEFFEKFVTKISTIGGIYLTFICVVPEILMSKSLISLYFSGTSFIIIVGVAVDFIERVKTTILTYRYEKLFKKGYGGLL